MELPERLKGHLRSKDWRDLSLKGAIQAVKRDLEKRKLIGRIKGKRPQRLRRLVTY
jgi:hypothetical protein